MDAAVMGEHLGQRAEIVVRSYAMVSNDAFAFSCGFLCCGIY